MKIPKIEKNPKRHGGIEYPRVTTWDVLKRYWTSIKRYWWVGVLVLIGTSASTTLNNLVIPTFFKRFFDVLENAVVPQNFDTTALVGIVVAILVLRIIAWCCSRMYWFSANYFETNVMRHIRQSAFDYALHHSHTFFSNNFTGALVQRINRYTRAFERLFDRLFMDIIPLIIKAGGSVFVVSLLVPTIAYIILAWIVIFLMISFFFSRFKLKYDIYGAELDSKVSGVMSDSLSNHSAVQLFTGSQHESKVFGEVNDKSWEISRFRWNVGSVQDALQGLLIIFVEFCIFYIGIEYWADNLLSLGTFVLIQAYIITLSDSLWGFARVIRDIYESFADAKEMVEILHLNHEVKDVPNAKKLIVSKGEIEFRNVGFRFGKEPSVGKAVFEGIAVTIKPGEKVAIIGPSGAGKSTLVKLLLRLHDIQSGQILVDGEDISKVTQESLRNNVSLVPQDPVLFHRTLMENIRYGKRDATDEEVIQAAKLAHCDIFINEFPQKYETYVGERGVKLSGGERQRVAIARAILKNAPILILDEATSSLDSHSEALIQDALHTLMKGKTTIVIAHRLSTIRNMDRIIVVSKGGVVEEGSHEELIKKPHGIYAKLWTLQAGGFANKSIEELLEV